MNRRVNVVAGRLSPRPPQRRSLEMPAGGLSTVTTGAAIEKQAFHGEAIRTPQSPNYYPAKSVIEWHVKEVFQGPERYRAPA